jgi:hypothetical protein
MLAFRNLQERYYRNSHAILAEPSQKAPSEGLANNRCPAKPDLEPKRAAKCQPDRKRPAS